MGSGTFVGEYIPEETLTQTDSDGVSVGDVLNEIGYKGDVPAKPLGDIHAYIELHIEQGPKLEQEELNVGVVDGALGISWLEATIYGEANHAGPIPMHTTK